MEDSKKYFATVSEVVQHCKSEIEPTSQIEAIKGKLAVADGEDIANYGSHFHNLIPKPDYPFLIISV